MDPGGFQEAKKDGSVARFSDFWEVSGALIILFVIYFVAATLLLKFVVRWQLFRIITRMRNVHKAGHFVIQIVAGLFLLFIVGVPLALAIIWGIQLQAHANLSAQLGWGIACIMIFITYSYLSLANWYGNGWALTAFTKIFFGLAVLAVLGYLIALVALPDNYSYSGTSALILGVNFLNVSTIMWIKNSNALIDVDNFVEDIVFQDLSALDWKSKVNYFKSQTQNKNRLTYLANFLFYFGSLVAFAVVNAAKMEFVDRIGWLHAGIIFFSDLAIIFYRNKQDSVFINKYTFKSGLMLLNRIIVCFEPIHWLAMQSIVFFITASVIVANNISNLMFRDKDSYKLSTLYLYQLCPELKAKISVQMPNMRIEPSKPGDGLVKKPNHEISFMTKFLMFIFENKIFTIIASYVFIAFFVIYFAIMVWLCHSNSTDPLSKAYCIDLQAMGAQKELLFSFQQHAIGILSFILVFIFQIFFIWLYMYHSNGYKLNFVNGIFILLGNAGIIIGGILYAILVRIADEPGRTTFIMACFICGSVWLTTALIFYGIWRNNDYQMYEKNPKQTGIYLDKAKDTWEFIQNFFRNIKRFLCCSYSPRTWRDQLCCAMLVFNVASVVVFTFVASYALDQWWIGFTIGCWAAIFELTFFMFTKFYQNYFNFSFTVQLDMFLSAIIYIVWAGFIGAQVKDVQGENREIYILLYYTFVFGYAFVFTLIMSLLKYQTIKSLENMPNGYKIIFSISTLIMMAFGVILIYATKSVDVLGAVIFVIGVYLLTYFWLRRWMLWANIVLGVLFVLFCVAGIIYYKDNAAIVLEILSLMLFVVFMIAFGLFCKESYENKHNMSNSIFLYSKNVMPVLAFSPLKKTMEAKNKELILFVISLAIYLIWSFLAGILTKVEDRYLGILMTVFGICCSFVFLNSIITEAQYLNADALGKLNDDSIQQSIDESLQRKEIWRGIRVKEGQRIESVNFQSQGQAKEPLQPDKRRQYMNVLFEWRDFQIKCMNKAGGVFRLFTLGQKEAFSESTAYRDEFLKETVLKVEQANKDEMMDQALEVFNRASQEQLFEFQFWAFFTSSLISKITNFKAQEYTKISSMLEGYKVDQKNNEKVKLLNLEDGSFAFHLEVPQNRMAFVSFIQQGNIQKKPTFDSEVIEINQITAVDQQVTVGQPQIVQPYVPVVPVQPVKPVQPYVPVQPVQPNVQPDSLNNSVTPLISAGMDLHFEELRKKEEEERRRKQEELEKIQREKDQRQFELMQKVQNQIVMGEVKEKNLADDQVMLIYEGDKKYQTSSVEQEEQEFSSRQALKGHTGKDYKWIRAKDLRPKEGRMVVFDDNIRACDIQQGALGNCYYLSALAVIAHTKPHLIKALFHPRSQQETEAGIYVVRMFKNKEPVVVTINDYFPANKNDRYPFCQVQNQEGGAKELWPIIMEKVYAKLYGDFKTIEGGWIDEAFSDLTGGAGEHFNLANEECMEMYQTGELWQNMKMYIESGQYLIGCGSPAGSDTDISAMGIAQGHAYSILDVCEIEGHKLIQIRNPWGNDTEWKGAWSDGSSQWTERMKRAVYDRMEQKKLTKSIIGEKDGIFWMALDDFMVHFDELNVCRFFSQEWVQLSYKGEWSKASGTNGGCPNYASFPQNPQLALSVQGSGPVEVYAQLTLISTGRVDGKARKAIGFQIYDLKGKKAVDRRIGEPVYEHRGGVYRAARDISMEEKMKPLPNPYTLIPQAFSPNDESQFIFTLWYKATNGSKVTLQPF